MEAAFQSNTGGMTGTGAGAGSSNWVVDGANSVLDILGRTAGIYTDVLNAQTKADIAELNNKNQPAAISSSPQPNAIELFRDADIKRIGLIIGGLLILAGGAAFVMGRK